MEQRTNIMVTGPGFLYFPLHFSKEYLTPGPLQVIDPVQRNLYKRVQDEGSTGSSHQGMEAKSSTPSFHKIIGEGRHGSPTQSPIYCCKMCRSIDRQDEILAFNFFCMECWLKTHVPSSLDPPNKEVLEI